MAFNMNGPTNGMIAINDVIPENIWVKVPNTNVKRIIILWLIPN